MKVQILWRGAREFGLEKARAIVGIKDKGADPDKSGLWGVSPRGQSREATSLSEPGSVLPASPRTFTALETKRPGVHWAEREESGSQESGQGWGGRWKS